MGLKTSEAAESMDYGGIKVTDGVFANLKTIKKVRDMSGKKIEHMNDKTFDLAIEVEFEDGRFPQLFLGNLQTDASGEVTGWGGGFIVARLFNQCDIDAELDMNNRFKAVDLKQLIGQQLYTVSYTAGTYTKDDGTKGQAYKTWNMVYSAKEDEEELAGIILEDWQKSRDKGYPSNYTYPIGTSKPSTGRRTTSPATKASATNEIDIDFDDMDDDMPF